MTMSEQKYVTCHDIAKRFSRRLYQVEYCLRVNGIAPALKVGNVRLFDEHQVAAIEAALKRIDANKAGGAR
jgi:hypothetical protein